MKILILGGNGFIGRNLAKCLLEREHEVFSFDYMEESQKIPGVRYLQGDFFDDRVLEEIIDGMDVIYHAISTINPGNSNERYMTGYSRDFVQTAKLCQMLEETGTRIIYLSSGGTVYGNQTKLPISENALPHPINHYGNLKLCIENTMLTFAFQNKVDVVIARISNPYGPGQDYTKGVGFIDAAIKSALGGKPIEVWGDGSVVRDYIYIADVCEMLAILAEKPNLSGTVINISSGVGTSLNDILRILKEKNEALNVIYKSARTVDAGKIILDNTQMLSIFRKEICSIEEGIGKYYNFLKEKMMSGEQ